MGVCAPMEAGAAWTPDRLVVQGRRSPSQELDQLVLQGRGDPLTGPGSAGGAGQSLVRWGVSPVQIPGPSMSLLGLLQRSW